MDGEIVVTLHFLKYICTFHTDNEQWVNQYQIS